MVVEMVEGGNKSLESISLYLNLSISQSFCNFASSRQDMMISSSDLIQINSDVSARSLILGAPSYASYRVARDLDRDY